MKYKLWIYGIIIFLMACHSPKDYSIETRQWILMGSDTMAKIDTIKLVGDNLRKNEEFNGYLNAGRKYYIDSLIAQHIDKLENETSEINEADYNLHLTASKVYQFQNKPIILYRIFADYAPFTILGGPSVIFTKQFGVIYSQHAHGRYTLNLSTISRYTDGKEIKEVNLENLVMEAKNDTILFPLPSLPPQPEILEYEEEQ